MATLMLLLLIVAGVIGLGMARVPLAIWALAAAKNQDELGLTPHKPEDRHVS